MPDLRVTFPNPCHEKWDNMILTGCHRICATCDKIIHNLSQYDVTEVQKLLQDEPDSCVRASVDAFGVVATKPERDGSIRRMIAIAGASAGLLISPRALAHEKRVNGSIVGTVEIAASKTTVTATAIRIEPKPNQMVVLR